LCSLFGTDCAHRARSSAHFGFHVALPSGFRAISDFLASRGAFGPLTAAKAIRWAGLVPEGLTTILGLPDWLERVR
jgi:hypothetical protein